jgi:hypothetical protein
MLSLVYRSMAVNKPVFTLDETRRVLYDRIHTYVLTDINYSVRSVLKVQTDLRQCVSHSRKCIFDLQIITVTHTYKDETKKFWKFFFHVIYTDEGVDLRLLACCDRGFESDWGHGCLSVVCVGCYQVQVYSTSWSLVQRMPTDCGASSCVIKKPCERGGHSPRCTAEPEIYIYIHTYTWTCIVQA